MSTKSKSKSKSKSKRDLLLEMEKCLREIERAEDWEFFAVKLGDMWDNLEWTRRSTRFQDIKAQKVVRVISNQWMHARLDDFDLDQVLDADLVMVHSERIIGVNVLKHRTGKTGLSFNKWWWQVM